jgi:cytochrome P450
MEKLTRRVEPTVIRYYQWRGDPLARWLRPQTKADPYPLYADIRRRGLVRSTFGPWMTADHAVAESILRDRRLSSSPVHERGYRPPAYRDGDPRAELPAADLLTLDPPDHTRIRRLVSGAFTPKAIAGLEPWIREVTGRLITSADAATGFDLIDALAFPLPIAVICHLLGVPAQDQAHIQPRDRRSIHQFSSCHRARGTAAFSRCGPGIGPLLHRPGTALSRSVQRRCTLTPITSCINE